MSNVNARMIWCCVSVSVRVRDADHLHLSIFKKFLVELLSAQHNDGDSNTLHFVFNHFRIVLKYQCIKITTTSIASYHYYDSTMAKMFSHTVSEAAALSCNIWIWSISILLWAFSSMTQNVYMRFCFCFAHSLSWLLSLNFKIYMTKNVQQKWFNVKQIMTISFFEVAHTGLLFVHVVVLLLLMILM